ncbi:MAG: DUF5683 domain-containing protein [Prevotella sp.]|nr:DUF5683 domain-containing protein [Prevotella sp.]MCM1075006.1 DUF5683 domain-containing protein [Ruminococcus sp.]
MIDKLSHIISKRKAATRIVAAILCMAFLLPPRLIAQEPVTASASEEEENVKPNEILDSELLIEDPNLKVVSEESDSILVEVRAPGYSPEYGLKRPFNPDPTRAVWLSALCPGLGQVYNRRYWKLPIIVAGFMGLGYGAAWNNNQFNDYAQAYTDLLDADPSTNSYMNFFPPTTLEGDLDRAWLQNILKSRKNYYRRNRELCIICMVGVYLLCMVDAYVDATMAHFDISPELSLDIQPTVFPEPGKPNSPAMGLNWAFTF